MVNNIFGSNIETINSTDTGKATYFNCIVQGMNEQQDAITLLALANSTLTSNNTIMTSQFQQLFKSLEDMQQQMQRLSVNREEKQKTEPKP